MNFNFNSKPEYKLNSSLAKEMINLYGILVKLVLIERINMDNTVFGDFSHLKSNSSEIFDMMVLPENTENWDSGGFNLTPFGPINYDNISLFVHRDSINLENNKITGNLLVLPNNKIMEITHTEFSIPGVNNLFTYDDAKTILNLTCVPYSQKIVSELNPLDKLYEPKPESEDFEGLEKYFDELMNREDELRVETEINPSVTVIKENINEPDEVTKEVLQPELDDVWGRF